MHNESCNSVSVNTKSLLTVYNNSVPLFSPSQPLASVPTFRSTSTNTTTGQDQFEAFKFSNEVEVDGIRERREERRISTTRPMTQIEALPPSTISHPLRSSAYLTPSTSNEERLKVLSDTEDARIEEERKSKCWSPEALEWMMRSRDDRGKEASNGPSAEEAYSMDTTSGSSTSESARPHHPITFDAPLYAAWNHDTLFAKDRKWFGQSGRLIPNDEDAEAAGEGVDRQDREAIVMEQLRKAAMERLRLIGKHFN